MLAWSSTAQRHLFFVPTGPSLRSFRPRFFSRGRFLCTSSNPSAPAPSISSDAVANCTRFESSFHTGSTPSDTISLHFVRKSEWASWLSSQQTSISNWLISLHGTSFPSVPFAPIPSASTTSPSLSGIVVPLSDDTPAVWAAGGLPSSLPRGKVYTIARSADLPSRYLELGWALGSYAYERYKSKKKGAESQSYVSGETTENSVNPTGASLIQMSDPTERAYTRAAAAATFLVRDVINAPAEDFGPLQLEGVARSLAEAYGAECTVIKGDDLLAKGYPQVHTVGRAATDNERAPRLVEIVWDGRSGTGAENDKKNMVTLVGKGVCYDTGGLSIKSTNSMITMKKDLGGAAQVLGLARMIMEMRLRIRLRVLIPAVENCVGGNAFRPGDVLTARNGMTTFNGNSDAEGRLILADALVAAAEEKPDLIVDCATLTGAQRVALGPDIPGLFCNDDEVAKGICDAGDRVGDMVWRLPLHKAYRKMLDSHIADIKSCDSGPYAGAITAALYLQEFVDGMPWVHLDFMAYNVASTPGRPEGGEAMGMRALFEYVRQRYGN